MDDQHRPQPPTRQSMPPSDNASAPEVTPAGASPTPMSTPQNLAVTPQTSSPQTDAWGKTTGSGYIEPSLAAPVETTQAASSSPPLYAPPAPAPQPIANQQAQPQATQQAEGATPSPSDPPPNNTPKKSEGQAAREELREAIKESNEVLATASTVWLVSLFPDIYTVDRTKITVHKRGIFGTTQVMSMRIEDVLNASATVGAMFGYLQLTNRIIANDRAPYTIGPFWRHDVLRLKRITQGYVIAMQKQIDVSALTANELATMLEHLGEDDHPNTSTGETES